MTTKNIGNILYIKQRIGYFIDVKTLLLQNTFHVWWGKGNKNYVSVSTDQSVKGYSSGF